MERDAANQLIRLAGQGNQFAFRQLVEAHQAFAWSLALRFVGDHDDAADLVQESFIRIWKNLSRYNPEFQFKTWLGKVVTNLCLDFLRSKKRRGSHIQRISSGMEEVKGTEWTDEGLENRDLMNAIFALSAQLSEKQRSVFLLRDMEGLTSDEVCEILEMTPGNLKSHLYYARIHLRKGLEKHYQQKDIIQ